MSITVFVALYMVSLPFLIVADLFWFGVIMKFFYQPRLAHILGRINWGAACLFYLLFTLGLTFFATYPAATKGTIATAFVLGGLYGLFTFGAYNLANHATVRDWPFGVTVVDVVRGSLFAAVISALAFFLQSFII